MLDNLESLPPDPILGLTDVFVADTNPNKINLGVGIYQDESADTPIMAAVQQAEQQLAELGDSKKYLPMVGVAAFNAGVEALMLGSTLRAELGARVASVQTPGGCGALRMGAELIRVANPQARVWLSTPTWPNHQPLMLGAGHELLTYPYYDAASGAVDFEGMCSALEAAQRGDVVLVHGCCHNPTGADLSAQHWGELTDLILRVGLIPFIDVAYQGLGVGLDEDVAGVREMVARVPEALISASCSKNFGLYRERTGALMVLGADPQTASAGQSHVLTAARRSYSMPPAHGGAVVATILNDAALTESWQAELAQMQARVSGVRRALADRLRELGHDFEFIAEQNGMFSNLGIALDEVLALRANYGIYMLDSTRMNLCGLNAGNLEYFCDALHATLKGA
ncbi:MAG: amino acid aminotransferase [Pseudomonadota bacterium]